MVKIDAEKRELVIDLDYRPGRRLADMVLQAIWTNVCTSDEQRAYVRAMSDMVCGRAPLGGMDTMTLTTDEQAKALYSPLEEDK
jgi:hypothetical protein